MKHQVFIPVVFADATAAALFSTRSVDRRLSPALDAFAENFTTRGRHPSGRPMTTALGVSTSPSKTPEQLTKHTHRVTSRHLTAVTLSGCQVWMLDEPLTS